MSRYVAWRILPGGKRRSIRPGGRRVFGPVTLAWVKRRARKRGHKIAVKQIRSKRDLIRATMIWALNHEPSIHYRQARPFPVNAFKRRRLPLWVDCSATTTMIMRSAGLPDPNGRKYNGTGYTGTLRAHCDQVPLHRAKVGDFIVYGPGTGAHVVVITQPGVDPIVWSHGQENGPRLYRHSQQVRVHGGYFTVHRPRGLK